MENEAAEKAAERIRKEEVKFHGIKDDIMKISLKKLIEGGAEIFIAMNINHQNIMFGLVLIIPLKEMIFRVWCLV